MKNEASKQALKDAPQELFICATLTGEIDRQRSFKSNFSDETLFRFVESVDGRNWTDSDADVHVSEAMRALRMREREGGKSWLNPAAIACALTHREKLLSEAEQRNVILCEDDALIRSDFIDLWMDNHVRDEFSRLDGIVLLHYMSRMPITTSRPPVSQFGKFKIFSIDDCDISSGACYYAPPLVAKQIRSHQNPISCSADHWTSMRKENIFRSIYVVHPAPARISGMASNIGYDSRSRSNALWIVLARRVKRLIQRKRQRLYEDLTIRAPRKTSARQALVKLQRPEPCCYLSTR